MAGDLAGLAVLASGVGSSIAVVASVYAIAQARRNMKEQDVSAIVTAVIVNERLKEEVAQHAKSTFDQQWWNYLKELDLKLKDFLISARDVAQTVASDRAQVLLSTVAMPRGEQNIKNAEFDRRLEAIEEKIDDVPQRTAEAVFIRLRESGARN